MQLFKGWNEYIYLYSRVLIDKNSENENFFMNSYSLFDKGSKTSNNFMKTIFERFPTIDILKTVLLKSRINFYQNGI